MPISRTIVAIALITFPLFFTKSDGAFAQGLVGARPMGWPDDREFAACVAKVRRNPKSMLALGELADAYSARQELAKAIPLRKRIIVSMNAQKSVDHEAIANAYSELANDLRRDRKFEEAEKTFLNCIGERQKAIQSTRTSSAHLKYCLEMDLSELGICYADDGKLPEAISAYIRLTALQRQPNDTHHNLSELKEKLQRMGAQLDK